MEGGVCAVPPSLHASRLEWTSVIRTTTTWINWFWGSQEAHIFFTDKRREIGKVSVVKIMRVANSLKRIVTWNDKFSYFTLRCTHRELDGKWRIGFPLSWCLGYIAIFLWIVLVIFLANMFLLTYRCSTGYIPNFSGINFILMLAPACVLTLM